jgi:hypothetical protein
MQRNYLDRIGDQMDRACEVLGTLEFSRADLRSAILRVKNAMQTPEYPAAVLEMERIEHHTVQHGFLPPRNADEMCEEIAREINAINQFKPDMVAYAEGFQGVLTVKCADGESFTVGTANETWAADFYPSDDAAESGECYVGFDTGIDGTCTDANQVAVAIVLNVKDYMRRRPVRGEFLERLRDFREAAAELNAAWGKLDAEDSSALVDYYPFQNSFDEMVGKIDEWVTQARSTLNDECQEHPADDNFAIEPKQAVKGT